MTGFVFDLQAVLKLYGLRASRDVEHAGILGQPFRAAVDGGFQSVEVFAGREQRESIGAAAGPRGPEMTISFLSGAQLAFYLALLTVALRTVFSPECATAIRQRCRCAAENSLVFTLTLEEMC